MCRHCSLKAPGTQYCATRTEARGTFAAGGTVAAVAMTAICALFTAFTTSSVDPLLCVPGAWSAKASTKLPRPEEARPGRTGLLVKGA